MSDQDRYIDTLRKQNLQQLLFHTLIALIIIGAVVAVPLVAKSHPDAKSLAAMTESNKQLFDLSASLSQHAHGAQIDLAIVADALRDRAAAFDASLAAINQQSATISQEGVQAIQLVGGSAILAVFGFLGLQRLRFLDEQIDALRSSVNTQISDRTTDMREHLSAVLAARQAETRSETDEFVSNAKITVKNIVDTSLQKFSASKDQFAQQTAEVAEQLNRLFQSYPWLQKTEILAEADKISNVSSAEQAHALAVVLRERDDTSSSSLALRQIIDRDLPGNADDYHNAQTEAMRMEEPVLAHKILLVGLKRHPHNHDLCADLSLALTKLGDCEGALRQLSKFHAEWPDEFYRSWRPAVFLSHAARGGKLTDDIQALVRSVLKEATDRHPAWTTPWTAWAEFETECGQLEVAINVLEDGSKKNPRAQDILVQLGRQYLLANRADEAVNCLERAILCDIQDTFQHDIDQTAILGFLAQAYEACERRSDATLLYQLLIEDQGHRNVNSVVRHYAANRIRMITVAEMIAHTTVDAKSSEESDSQKSE